ncbi:TPA: hypothetical protein HA361_02685 [Candidatus Woesearchaeota archaeon]|nr:hypothetical protein [Candidatus Woesearchaeota archaeon]
MSNRKGNQGFDIPFIAIAIVVMLTAAVITFSVTAEQTREVGSAAVALYDTVNLVDVHLAYRDIAATMAAQEALMAQAESGGFYGTPSCGAYLGYALWTSASDSCVPERQQIMQQYLSYFSVAFDRYLSQHPQATDSSAMYEFTIRDEDVLGLSRSALSSAIQSQPSEDASFARDAFLPRDAPALAAEGALKSGEQFKITYYYTPYEGDFRDAQGRAVWSTADSKDIGSMEACRMPLAPSSGTVNKLNRGFYEDVKCQGSGITLDGRVCLAGSIKPTREASNCIRPEDDSRYGKNGVTRTGENPQPKLTIAVDPDKIPLRSKVTLAFPSPYDSWSGGYIAQDIGSGIRGNHIDVYVGVGQEALAMVRGFPETALVKPGWEQGASPAAEPSLITMRAVQEQEAKGRRTYGDYIFDPSFRVQEPELLLETYAELADFVQGLLAYCKDSADTIACAEQRAQEFNNAGKESTLSVGSCEAGAERLFADYVVAYLSCLHSADDGCVCSSTFSYAEDAAVTGDYAFSFPPELGIVLGRLFYPLSSPAGRYSLIAREGEEHPNLMHALSFDESGKLVSSSFTLPSGNSVNYPSLLLYKSNGALTFIQDKESKPACATSLPALQFCAVPSASVLHYDGSAYKQTHPVIRFSVVFQDPPPPQVTGIAAQSKAKASGALLLSWDRNPAADLDHYNVYISPIDFEHTPLDEQFFVTPAQLKPSDAIPLKDIDLNQEPSCFLADGFCTYKYLSLRESSTGSIGELFVPLDAGSFYSIENQKRYLYVASGYQDGETYAMAVTAVDRGGNEIDNVQDSQKLQSGINYQHATPEDSLPPGQVAYAAQLHSSEEGKSIAVTWESPQQEMDGSPLKEPGTLSYAVYAFTSEDAFFTEHPVPALTTHATEAALPISTLPSATTYFIHVTAKDPSGNEHWLPLPVFPSEITAG